MVDTSQVKTGKICRQLLSLKSWETAESSPSLQQPRVWIWRAISKEKKISLKPTRGMYGKPTLKTRNG